MARKQKSYIFFILGMMLVIVGIAGLVYTEITFRRTKTIKLGPVSIEEPLKKVFNVPPLIAIGLIGGGVILIYIGIKK